MRLKNLLNLTALAFLAVMTSFPSQADPKKMYGIQGHDFSIVTKSSVPTTYSVKGQTYTTKNGDEAKFYAKEGLASYYHLKFNGRKTASGDIYNSTQFTAAHKTLPMNSYALVTNLHNNRKVIVRINDRGPFSDKRLIDLSHAAAKELGLIARGTGHVRIEALHLARDGQLSGAAAETLVKHAKNEEAIDRLNKNVKKPSYSTELTRKKTSQYMLKMSKFPSRKQAEQFVEKSALKDVKIKIMSKGKQYEIHFGPFDAKQKVTQAKKKLQKIATNHPLIVYTY